jgi:hypothetical protein
MPYARYVIREKGKIELGNLSCSFCHTRVLPDGTVIKGGQGNFPFDKSIPFWERRRLSADQIRQGFLLLFSAPWLPDKQQFLEKMSPEEIHAAYTSVPPGVLGRNRSSIFRPTAIPDLFGIRQRKYLDKSGLVVNRGIADIIRYAATAEGIDFLSDYGGFVPFGEDFKKLPPPETFSRFSEEQLYAVALYLYSLRPPRNPNRFDDRARQGQKVFQQQGCPLCHPAPLYTNNKLLPVDGFRVPAEHRKKYDLLDVRIGTDPILALETRRGTGYYKVPSLKNIWARGPLEHNGSVATLEDWFDPRRLKADYVPTGFVGYGVKTRAVKGHEFGLQLPDAAKNSPIAFLRTL